MSETEDGIVEKANIILSSNTPIKKSEMISKLSTVHTAGMISKKPLTPGAIRKLLKRMNVEATDKQLAQALETAKKAFAALRKQKKEEIEKLSGELPEYLWFNDDGVLQFDYIKYTDHLHRDLHVHNFMKNLFIYDEKTKVYKNHINQIETHVRETVKKHNIPGRLVSIEQEVTAHMKSMGCTGEYPFVGKFGTIHVLNGSLDLDTGIITPTNHAMLYDYRIETEYKPFPDGTPELDAFLEQYGTTEPIDVLAKVLWQRAYHDTLKELTVFYGPKDCGKTTLAELIQVTLEGGMTSRNNVSRTLLHELLQRFGYSSLDGKLLNFGDDLPDMFIRNSGRMNELVGSVIRHIEKKGIDGYDALVTAYYLFTTNNLPPLDDDDNAIWGKIHLVECTNVVTKSRVPRIQLFTETIREQLLFRAVEKALSYKTTPYVNTQTPDWVREKWHESGTNVDAFLVEAIEVDTFGRTSLEEIKKAYEDWSIIREKTRYMKYLTKRLKPYFKKLTTGNVYTVKIKEYMTHQERELVKK